MKSLIVFIFSVFSFTVVKGQLSAYGGGGGVVKRKICNRFTCSPHFQLGIFYNSISADTQYTVGNDTVFGCTVYSAELPKKCSKSYCPLTNHKVYVCKSYKKKSLKIVGKKYTDSVGKIDLIANRRDNYYYVVIDRIGGIGHHFIFDSSELIPKFPNFQTRRQHKRWLNDQKSNATKSIN